MSDERLHTYLSYAKLLSSDVGFKGLLPVDHDHYLVDNDNKVVFFFACMDLKLLIIVVCKIH